MVNLIICHDSSYKPLASLPAYPTIQIKKPKPPHQMGFFDLVVSSSSSLPSMSSLRFHNSEYTALDGDDDQGHKKPLPAIRAFTPPLPCTYTHCNSPSPADEYPHPHLPPLLPPTCLQTHDQNPPLLEILVVVLFQYIRICTIFNGLGDPPSPPVFSHTTLYLSILQSSSSVPYSFHPFSTSLADTQYLSTSHSHPPSYPSAYTFHIPFPFFFSF